MEKKIKVNPVKLDAKVIRELQESKLTVEEFMKRYGIRRRIK